MEVFMKNIGISNEYNIVKAYNGKKFKELNSFQKEFMKELFSSLDDESVITASKFTKTAKPDIYLSCGNQIKFISIKSGKTDSVHFEKIKDFILFLRKNGISKETQKTLLLFHYGDGTLTGSGKIRKPFNELIVDLKDKIEKANLELNSSFIIEKTFYRACIDGNEYRSNSVDYFYYGDEKYGVYISKEKLLSFILRKRHYTYYSPHIGPMTIQPYLRDVNYKSKNTFKRDYLQIKWHYFLADIERAKLYNR